MKKYSLIGFVAIVLLLASAWIAVAEQPIVVGHNDGISRDMTCSKSSYDFGHTCELRVVAVFIKENPNIEGAHLDAKTGNYVLEYDKNPEAFAGATLYALGTGKYKWRGGKALGKVKVDNALAATAITKEYATLKFKNEHPDADGYYQIEVYLIQFANGKRAWGGVPDFSSDPNKSGSWLVYNINGEVQVMKFINNKTGDVECPGKRGRDIAKGLE